MTTDETRVERLLRSAGDLEQAPPSGVWEAISRDVQHDTHMGRGVVTGPAPAERWSRRSRVVPLLLAAAAGAGLMFAGTQLTRDERVPEVTRLAAGTLGPVDGTGRLGDAEVVERDGQRLLRVHLDRLPAAENGYLEVWLLRPDVSGLVTLGVLDAPTEEFALPAALDLEEYPVVDISVEHLDGDPGHGGDSVVRGQVG